MSHQKLRKDKRCQNCGHYVDKRFCPNCGQENVETRQPFHYLFTHFVAYFVNYDSLFWKTIKYLLFYPARLTQEYIAGKRKSYVQPVQLYLCISFLVFFIPAILPDFDATPSEAHQEATEEIHKALAEELNIQHEDYGGISLFGLENVKTIHQLDSLQRVLPKEEKLSGFKYAIYKKALKLKYMDKEDFKKKIPEALMNHLPKAIFLYMPIFAFWLWVFHGKKKWLYFDHGIYTLHYFSFILLTILLYIVINWALGCFDREIPDFITLAIFCYFIFYFFRSHSRFYRQTKAVSRLTCSILFIINTLGIIIFLVLYALFIVLISLISI